MFLDINYTLFLVCVCACVFGAVHFILSHSEVSDVSFSLVRHLFGPLERPNVYCSRSVRFVVDIIYIPKKIYSLADDSFRIDFICGVCVNAANDCRCSYALCMGVLYTGTEMMASSCLANTTLTNFFSFRQSKYGFRCATKSLHSLSCCDGCYFFISFLLSFSTNRA